ncbi:hypothetical protein GCM10011352_00730 [Marinobacterium zhoushanense]|uniref:FecR protein domain-containing protein n=1 Tax=Marinobacterium zhoushanense TaxID=1679163 RepID=A0ABQ1JWL2_9GAMM|nr:FecR family protein [Marinobacterium zhoushanense]GGB78959.1 hypothetical protein GCM10011352_00730 [Marinobacterium zhoushanense]
MRRLLKTLVLILFLGGAVPSSAWAEVIGMVVMTQGHPVVEREERRLELEPNDDLFERDRLITPKGSRVLLKLRDKTTVSLAENSVFELTEYSFDDDTSDVSFKLLKGAFRAISGLIGQQENPKFEVKTSTALIGIRGTDFWGGFIFTGDLDVAMFSGKGVYVENDFGRVELTEASAGTTVVAGRPPSDPIKWKQGKLSRAAAATEVSVEKTGTSGGSDY